MKSSRKGSADCNANGLPTYGFDNIDPRIDPEPANDFKENYPQIISRRTRRWETAKYAEKPRNNKMKRFVRKGVPPSLREAYWMKVTGMDKRMEEEPGRFNKLLEQAEKADPNYISMIDTDVPRTFPENSHFGGNSATHDHSQKLKKVLRAFSAAMPDIGYCQGLNFVAAVILLVVNDAEEAFYLLEHLIKEVVPSGYYSQDMVELKRDCDVLACLVKEKMPKLSERFESEGISYVVICTKWFICLYCDTLPFETSLRVLDCLFYEGDKILFRVALTLLQMNSKELENNCHTFPQILQRIQKMVAEPNTLFCHEFMQQVFTAPGSLPRKKVEKLRQEFVKNYEKED